MDFESLNSASFDKQVKQREEGLRGYRHKVMGMECYEQNRILQYNLVGLLFKKEITRIPVISYPFTKGLTAILSKMVFGKTGFKPGI
jgi:hypothetical protein